MSVSIILPYFNRRELIRVTLNSFQFLYGNRKDFEVVIVDDGSDVANRLEDLVSKYSLDIRLVRIDNKRGFNPCYPYNVGVKQSSGDIIVLSSPETFHTTDMFKIADFDSLRNNAYFQFSVFCLVDHALKESILSSNFETTAELINQRKPEFYQNLGEFGYPFNNRMGSWYTHSQIRPSCLNFLSALTKDNYYKLSGFDERFVCGTGYDDEEFKNRILRLVGGNIVWHDDAVAIHIDHEIVNKAEPTTNFGVFKECSKLGYHPNKAWGEL